MEIRARYVLMGFFTLAVILSTFAFLYWLHSTGGFRDRTVYRIQVENSVSGLQKGAAVLFNGIRVGEVTDLRLNPNSPSQVLVLIAVNNDTPLRADTRVDIDSQGLTGVAYITMNGGSSASPLLSTKGDGTLVANSNGQSMGAAARDALHRLNTILDENAAPLRNTIGNLSTFSDVLAKNSDRADNILAGLERMTGGKSSGSGQLNDLTAQRAFSGLPKSLKAQLVVSDPTALIALDTQNILIKRDKSDTSPAATAPAPRWADNLPKLIQARLIQSFENGGFLGAVNRPGDGATPDYQLLIDVRNFQATLTGSPTAEVELTAKIMEAGGKVVEGKIFRVTQPVSPADNDAAIMALNTAFGKVATDLVVWASNTVANAATVKEKAEAEAAQAQAAPAPAPTDGEQTPPAQPQ